MFRIMACRYIPIIPFDSFPANHGQHLDELETYIKDTDAKLGKGKGGVLSVNQIELHPWLQRRDIIDWCQKRGVLVQAWAPLAQANRWNDPTLKDIVKRTGKTEAQILLRWSLQKVRIHSAIYECLSMADPELFDDRALIPFPNP